MKKRVDKAPFRGYYTPIARQQQSSKKQAVRVFPSRQSSTKAVYFNHAVNNAVNL